MKSTISEPYIQKMKREAKRNASSCSPQQWGKAGHAPSSSTETGKITAPQKQKCIGLFGFSVAKYPVRHNRRRNVSCSPMVQQSSLSLMQLIFNVRKQQTVLLTISKRRLGESVHLNSCFSSQFVLIYAMQLRQFLQDKALESN